MSYQFENSASLIDDLRRIAAEQLDKAIEEIESEAVDRHETVHQIRKHFKKLRSLARLVRPGLGDQFDEINHWYRDAGRRLSRVRDIDSIREAVERLREWGRAEVDEAVFASVENALQFRKQRITEDWTDLEDQLDQLKHELAERRAQVNGRSLSGEDREVVLYGLAKCYKLGCKTMCRAAERCSNGRLHEWRKCCKDHWYHLRLLQDLWPVVMQARISACSELCDLLGDDHDLAMLTTMLEDHVDEFGGEQQVSQLRNLIHQRRRELQQQAFALGRRVFADKPKRLRQQLNIYWQIWKTESDHNYSS